MYICIKSAPPIFSLVPTFTDRRGGGRGAISVAMKKTWRKIASTSSTNILVLRT
jgi:hypothetical protein